MYNILLFQDKSMRYCYSICDDNYFFFHFYRTVTTVHHRLLSAYTALLQSKTIIAMDIIAIVKM